MFQVQSKVIQLFKSTYIIFKIIFHPKLLQYIQYSSLSYTVNLCCLLHIYFLIKSLASYSYCVKQVDSKCHIFLVRQKFICFLKYICYTYLCIYVYKSFSTILDKGLKKNIKKRKDGETGEYKLNEMGALYMKFKK